MFDLVQVLWPLHCHASTNIWARTLSGTSMTGHNFSAAAIRAPSWCLHCMQCLLWRKNVPIKSFILLSSWCPSYLFKFACLQLGLQLRILADNGCLIRLDPFLDSHELDLIECRSRNLIGMIGSILLDSLQQCSIQRTHKFGFFAAHNVVGEGVARAEVAGEYNINVLDMRSLHLYHTQNVTRL